MNNLDLNKFSNKLILIKINFIYSLNKFYFQTYSIMAGNFSRALSRGLSDPKEFQ